MNWRLLDQQMQSFSDKLVSEVRVSADNASKLATYIAADVRFLSVAQKDELKAASPVPLTDRLSELQAFQGWIEFAGKVQNNPSIARAQVLTQSYICFVYLPKFCFRALARVCPSGSAARKCAKYLSDNPIRAYRNAIAHANWTYRDDYEGIVYWARKGTDPLEPLERFEVKQIELSFWQALSRCVAYAAFSNI